MSLLFAARVLPCGDVLLRYAEKFRVVGGGGSAGTVIVVLPVCVTIPDSGL